jgi:hypothetical protein
MIGRPATSVYSDGWRKIAITLIDLDRPNLNECRRLLSFMFRYTAAKTRQHRMALAA